MLLCTVRSCLLPLRRSGARMVCPRGHCFDIARSGYINLLQPQDRRSKRPGDTPEAVAARRRLHDSGVTAPILNAIAGLMAPTKNDILLDAGCGEGFYLGGIVAKTGSEGHGVDISAIAIEAAAKRYARCEWVVANADRFLPYSDGSFSAAMCITGRMNAAELARVLVPHGKLLVALPAPGDLIELRGRGLAAQPGRDRVPRAIEAFAKHFEMIGHEQLRTCADCSAGAVQDVLISIYRPMPRRAIEPMRLTFSMDLLLFRRKAR